jgi:hypothetical protein
VTLDERVADSEAVGKHTYLSSGCLYIFYGASVSAATACTGTLFALAHTYHRVCIIVGG